MIVIEDRLTELFSLIPEIQINSINSKKPVFSWGEKEELNRWIELYDSSLYPLIWLLPSKDTHNLQSNLVEKNVSLIIATLETRDELLNPQRYKGSFQSVLNPLTDYVLQALENSSITRLVNPSNVDILKKPNYSDREENGTIDKWDAVRIDCEVEFNNNCLRNIQWI